MGEPKTDTQAIVRCSDLLAEFSGMGRAYRLLDPDLAPEAPVLQGHFRNTRLRPGLSVHTTDACAVHELTTQSVQQESLRIAVVLDGEIDLALGGRRFGLGACGAGRKRQPQAAFITLREPELLVRRGRRGGRERKVIVTFSREWLMECGAGDEPAGGRLRALMDRHLAVEHWTPTSRAVALAEQLIHPPAYALLPQRLYLESRAVELAAETLQGFLAATPAVPRLLPREQARIAQVRELLESGEADAMSLADIARHAGTNASTLQKQFRAVFGTSVFEYLRRGRLLRARQALERDGCSIVEAAGLAGYTCPANFATAYRRLFGITPRQSRAGF